MIGKSNAGGGKKEGLYVWKRYKIENKQVQLSFSVTNSSSPYKLKVGTTDPVALKIATASSFVGIHGVWDTNGYYEFPDANTLRIYDGTNTYNFTSVYDPATNIFTVTSATGIGNTTQFADCTHTMQAGTFEGFVVSDNESTYPDGGTQDGYWYEKVVEGIPVPAGINKFAIDKFTFTSDTHANNMKIAHSLGEVPLFAFIVAGSRELSDDRIFMMSPRWKVCMSNGSLEVHGQRYSINEYIGSNEYVTLDNYIEKYFKKGVEYTLITMA